MSHERFNEESLLRDVCDEWGAHGAHAHICRWLINEVDKLRGEVFALQRQLDETRKET